eukprot:5065528-Prymnesium_polylepis.1
MLLMSHRLSRERRFEGASVALFDAWMYVNGGGHAVPGSSGNVSFARHTWGEREAYSCIVSTLYGGKYSVACFISSETGGFYVAARMYGLGCLR